MTDHTTRFAADKPELEDYFDDIITAIRSALDMFDAACQMLVVPAADGNLVQLDGTTGQVEDAGVKAADLARRASAPTSGHVATVDADGDPTDSGVAITDVARRASTPTNGHAATLDSDGDPTDSGIAMTDIARRATSPTNGHVAGIDADGDPTDSGSTVADMADAITKKHAAAGDDNFASLGEKTTPTGAMKVPVNDGTYGFMTRQNFLLGVKGGINFITNSDFEGDTVGQVPAGWGTYKDAAQATPEDGTGGSPSVTFLTSEAVILNGGKSARIDKPESNCQGEGVNFLFDVPVAYRAGMVRIQLPYVPVDAIATGDFTIWIYDVTNGALIQPTPYQVEGRTAGTPGAVVAEFQAPYNMAQGRLLWHVATTSASHLRVDVDEIQVGPGSRVFGPVMQDTDQHAPWTPVFTNLPGTTYGKWERMGELCHVWGSISISGAATGNIRLTLPFSADLVKIGNPFQRFGIANAYDNAGIEYRGAPFFNNDTTYVQFIGGSLVWNATVPFTWGAGDELYFEFWYPVSGWGSNCQMSSDADTRVISCVSYLSGNLTGLAPNNSNVKINLDSILHDTHGAFDVSAYRYNVKIPGKYRINGLIQLAGTNLLNNIYYSYIYKNGSVIATGALATPATGAYIGLPVYAELDLLAGDYIELFLHGDGNNSINTLIAIGGSAYSRLSISRISGPSQIAASEKVNVIASTAAGQNIGSAGAVVVFGTKAKDSHGAYNAATGRFIAPRYGIYHVEAFLTTVSFSGVTANTVAIKLLKTDSTFKMIGQVYQQNGVNTYWKAKGSIDVELNAGEGFDIVGISDDGTHALASDGNYNWLTISG